MLIGELSNETIDNLCSTLEKSSIVGWRKLMTKGFAALYSERDANDLEKKEEHPARALLDDLIYARKLTLKELVIALEEIGNKGALSIIEEGRFN